MSSNLIVGSSAKLVEIPFDYLIILKAARSLGVGLSENLRIYRNHGFTILPLNSAKPIQGNHCFFHLYVGLLGYPTKTQDSLGS